MGEREEISGGWMAELYQLATLGRMLAGVVHEISTPVGSIVSNHDVLARSLESLAQMPLPEKAARTVGALRELAAVDGVACERLEAIIRSVKTLARTKATEPVRADLNELLRDALKLVAHQFRRRVEVETDLGELPAIECHPHLLGQVFVNLLVNAGQAIEGQGKVTVRSRAEGGAVHVSVSDTGHGIDPAHRDRIFAAGFTTKPFGAGTGLGLAISREIIDSHGGSIDFESHPGAGSTFHIRIPTEGVRRASAPAGEGNPAESGKRPPPAASGGKAGRR